jgi:hypothetical protein
MTGHSHFLTSGETEVQTVRPNPSHHTSIGGRGVVREVSPCQLQPAWNELVIPNRAVTRKCIAPQSASLAFPVASKQIGPNPAPRLGVTSYEKRRRHAGNGYAQPLLPTPCASHAMRTRLPMLDVAELSASVPDVSETREGIYARALSRPLALLEADARASQVLAKPGNMQHLHGSEGQKTRVGWVGGRISRPSDNRPVRSLSRRRPKNFGVSVRKIPVPDFTAAGV